MTKNRELLNGTLITEKEENQQGDSSQFSNYEKVEGTPFAGVKDIDESWFIVLGNYRASKENFESFEDLDTHVKSMTWELISNLCAVICETYLKEIKK